jgi:hypothetical protein
MCRTNAPPTQSCVFCLLPLSIAIYSPSPQFFSFPKSIFMILCLVDPPTYHPLNVKMELILPPMMSTRRFASPDSSKSTPIPFVSLLFPFLFGRLYWNGIGPGKIPSNASGQAKWARGGGKGAKAPNCRHGRRRRGMSHSCVGHATACLNQYNFGMEIRKFIHFHS